MEKTILLCCGAGMSSGLIASKARKAAKKRELAINIEARSESDVASYLSSIDIILLGPHYAEALHSMTEMAAPHKVPVVVIPKDVYAMMDGEKLLDLALENMTE